MLPARHNNNLIGGEFEMYFRVHNIGTEYIIFVVTLSGVLAVTTVT